MSKLTLRRIPTDPPWLSKRLSLLEASAAAGEVEPWLAVATAELMRRTGPTRDADDGTSLPPDEGELEALLLDAELVEMMRAQADGPWAVYVAQAQAAEAARRFAAGLSSLSPDGEAVPAPTVAKQQAPATPRLEPSPAALFPKRKWDVAISYSRSDGAFVRQVARYLVHEGLRVFYDDMEAVVADLWGCDLAFELPRIYREEAAYCIVFISEKYAAGVWTKLELKNALGRALEDEDYIKPIRLDDATLPGLSTTIAYLDARPGRLFAEASVLCPVIVRAIRRRAGGVPEMPADALLPTASVPGTSVRDYFDTVLPAMLKWRTAPVDMPGVSCLFWVTGDEEGAWLIRLESPAPSVVRLRPDEDVRPLTLGRHLRIKITSTAMRGMLNGRFVAREALIEGSVELDGDLTTLKDIGRVFVRA